MLSFFLLIILFSYSIYSTEIATFKLSYIIDNSLEFDEFINKLDTLKAKMQNELLEDENILIEKKNKIEESKIIFSETEYNEQIEKLYIINPNSQVFTPLVSDPTKTRGVKPQGPKFGDPDLMDFESI